MRGSPFIRLLVIAIFLVVAGIPVWSLTRPKSVVPATPPETAVATPEAMRPVEITLTSTGKAIVTVQYAGKTLWQSPEPAEAFTPAIPLPESKDATDLVIKSRWVEPQARNALRFQAARDGDSLADTTLWGNQEVEGVVTLAPPAP